MAKPKRFSALQFTKQLDEVIDLLIETKHNETSLIQTDLQVNDIALVFGVNSATLRRWCNEHTGISPKQYLTIHRVELAKRWLMLGVRPVNVSQRLAYTEHKVFSSVFKRTTNNTPSQFIQSHNNQ